MSALLEWQRNFHKAIFRHGTPPGIRAGGLSVGKRFAIYRNNYVQGLVEALRDGFPVINRLVGAECFDGVARRFVQVHPPASGCLLDYGEELPGFLEIDPATSRLAYLVDVARLEWAWHEAFHAANEPIWRLSDMAAVPPHWLAGLRWRPHPSVRLLESPWPLIRIYQLNQVDDTSKERIDLRQEKGCAVLVFRPEFEVLLMPLSSAEYGLLGALAADGDLNHALSAALAAEPDFEPGAGLARLFSLGVFGQPVAYVPHSDGDQK